MDKGCWASNRMIGYIQMDSKGMHNTSGVMGLPCNDSVCSAPQPCRTVLGTVAMRFLSRSNSFRRFRCPTSLGMACMTCRSQLWKVQETARHQAEVGSMLVTAAIEGMRTAAIHPQSYPCWMQHRAGVL